MTHQQEHLSHRVGWLRAAVLGANDGIVSTASLILGVAAASTTSAQILLAGSAGLVAGAMSMAAGEYVSVSSQADTEKADLALERASLAQYPAEEEAELANIYQARGLSAELATQVASQLMAFDALGAHARDDIGLPEASRARPLQASIYSAGSFGLGAALPLTVAWLAPLSTMMAAVSLFSLALLALLGAVAALVGGASVLRGALRVTFWGATAMVLTAAVGGLFGVAA